MYHHLLAFSTCVTQVRGQVLVSCDYSYSLVYNKIKDWNVSPAGFQTRKLVYEWQ